MPILENASNIEDNTRFSIEEVMKYSHAADIPDPKKLTTKQNIITNLLEVFTITVQVII